MLLLGHRNHRITIVSTPFTPLWIRYWPKLRFSDSFDLVARYYNLDRKLLLADQRLFSQFKAAHVEKSIKTAAEVIEVLNENSFHEMTPELIKLKGRVHSGRHPLNIMLDSALVQRTLKDLPSVGRNRLGTLATVCVQHSYGNKVIVDGMDKIINIFGQRHGSGKTFSFSNFNFIKIE